jgi:hypothetical protein
MSYIGSTPVTQSFIAGTDYFNGTGSQTAFTLSRSVVSVNDIQATVNNVVQVPNDAYTVSGTTITFTSAPSAGTNNVYVRYLSTTTQSITPSQGTVSWSTLNADVQQDLGISFKNRIINGAMVIDQRNSGASVTVASGRNYYLDRFSVFSQAGSKLTIQQNAGSVTPPAGFTNYAGITVSTAVSPLGAGDQYMFEQQIEGYNVADLNFGSVNAKTVTLSFWVRSSLTGSFAGVIGNGGEDRNYPFTYTISAANTWTQISVTIPGDTSGTWLTTNGVGLRLKLNLGTGTTYSGTANAWTSSAYISSVTGTVNLINTVGATWYVTGVMLEIGTQATTFDYRSIGTEYGLCQRYYYKIYGNNNYSKFGTGPAGSTTGVFVMCQLQTLMRDKPSSITTTGSFGIWAGATVFSVSSVVLEANTGQNIGTVTATTAGVTAEKTYQLLANVDSTATLAFSAEL